LEGGEQVALRQGKHGLRIDGAVGGGETCGRQKKGEKERFGGALCGEEQENNGTKSNGRLVAKKHPKGGKQP